MGVLIVQSAGHVGDDAEQQPRRVAHHPPFVRLEFPLGPQRLEPGDLSIQVVGVDVDVHPRLAAANPLDDKPDLLAWQVSEVVLGVLFGPYHFLSGRCLPEVELVAVDFLRNIDDDLAQPAVMGHEIYLRARADTP